MILRIFLLTLTLLYFGEASSVDKCNKKQPYVSKIVNFLSTELEERIGGNANYFFSPLSITVALAMVYIGAHGTTREQMTKALDINAAGKNFLPSKISESFRELIALLENEGKDYSFFVANGAFVQTGYKISEIYSSNLEKYFNSNVQSLDFAHDEQGTLNTINDWVANYTKGKIANLLKEPLDPLTVMILVNAVYFKGLWELQFNEMFTKTFLFYRINEKPKNASFMILREKFNYYSDEEDGYSFLELDYVSGNISMIIVLPNSIEELPVLTLSNELLCNLREKFEEKTVTVFLPKFSMGYKRELSKDMINMGMEELFSDRADLSGIREQNDLHVSLMVHKAVIEVNEKGSEAAATTGIGIDGRHKTGKREMFLADHPFLFYIVHKESDTIMFSGRVMDP